MKPPVPTTPSLPPPAGVVLVDPFGRGRALAAALHRTGVRTVTTASPAEGLVAALATRCPLVVWVNPQASELAEGDELAMVLAETGAGTGVASSGLWCLSEAAEDAPARLTPWREPIVAAMPRGRPRRTVIPEPAAAPTPQRAGEDDGLRLSREELDMLLGPWPGGG